MAITSVWLSLHLTARLCLTVPGEDTQFKKDHARPEKAGRRKGTPNKPKTIKIAMREFTDEEGNALLAWARHVLFELPDAEVDLRSRAP